MSKKLTEEAFIERFETTLGDKFLLTPFDYKDKLKYLSEIATNINSSDSWGMISATLGNKRNNYDFICYRLEEIIEGN